jgi:PAS domain S-box-containing protein
MTAKKRDRAAAKPRPSQPATALPRPPAGEPGSAERRPLDGPAFEEAGLWQRTFDAVPDLLAILDTQHRIVRLNQALAERLGLSKEQCIGQTCYRCIHGTDEPPANCPHFQLLQDGREHTAEIREERLGGDFLMTVSPLRDTAGNFVGSVHSAREITERKQAESEREITVEVLRLISQRNDRRELMRAVTGLLRQWTGCDAVGIRLHEGEDFPYFETRGLPAEFVLGENRLCMVDERGEPARDGAGDPILACMCGNVIRGRFDPSKPFFTARGSFWTNSTTELLASTADADRTARTRNRCNGEGYESVALIPLRAGGETYGLLQLNDRRRGRFTAKGISLLEGLADSVAFGLAHRKAEESLRRSELIRVEAEKLAAGGRMAARIAHEINNPLAGIKNSFRLIRDAVPKEHPDRDMVERIEREIDRIAQIVRQMYQLHSPQAQKPRDIFVAETIADVLAMLEPLCRQREVTVEMGAVPADLRVWAPDGGLQQILYNLTVNAVNASRAGESVNISAECVDNNFVRMSIRDHGHGIPAELRDKVFEPFFSADSTDLTKHGLGLGLSIVKSLVISVGGRIEFESAVDEGTCFHVCLPSRRS